MEFFFNDIRVNQTNAFFENKTFLHELNSQR